MQETASTGPVDRGLPLPGYWYPHPPLEGGVDHEGDSSDHEDISMRITPVLALLLVTGCARNSDTEEGMRVRDTTLTAADTTAPEDTLDRARRAVPDTTGDLDTTSRR
jgi:hypothetical protein